MDEKGSGFLLVTLATGIAIGAAIGILIAPDKGSETIKRIKQNAGKLADKLKGEIEEEKYFDEYEIYKEENFL